MRILLTILFIGVSISVATAQQDSIPKSGNKKNANDPLVFRSIKNTPDLIFIEYTLPFEGIVEFELRNEEEEVIWKSQFVGKTGDNQIKFSTKPLTTGKYYYSLYYKGRETRKYFDYRPTN
jgi:hypothetical protein